MEHSEGIGKSSCDELVHICALFGKESGDLGISLGVGQVYLLVRGIDVTAADNFPALCFEGVDLI